MSYQTSSKRSPPFCPLIGQKNTKVFWHQSEVRTAATVWNWSGRTLSPGALLAVFYFHIFPPVWTFPRPHFLPLGLRGWSNTFVPQTLYENLQAKKMNCEKLLGYLSFQKPQCLRSKRTIQGIFIFNIASKSRKSTQFVRVFISFLPTAVLQGSKC